jgi:hypothetical protein
VQLLAPLILSSRSRQKHNYFQVAKTWTQLQTEGQAVGDWRKEKPGSHFHPSSNREGALTHWAPLQSPQNPDLIRLLSREVLSIGWSSLPHVIWLFALNTVFFIFFSFEIIAGTWVPNQDFPFTTSSHVQKAILATVGSTGYRWQLKKPTDAYSQKKAPIFRYNQKVPICNPIYAVNRSLNSNAAVVDAQGRLQHFQHAAYRF